MKGCAITMRFKEFVITGGPCAGKTTGIKIIKRKLTQRGYKVIVVAETATELISSGISPKELSRYDFQSILIDRSIIKEETARKAANCLKEKVVILYDRGLLDTKAYISQEEFQLILKEKGLKEKKIRNQYDAVFHLVTAADGAEEYYSLKNNKARSETPEQARELDKKTRDSWKKHKNLFVIDNSTNFNEKINRLLSKVYACMELSNS